MSWEAEDDEWLTSQTLTPNRRQHCDTVSRDQSPTLPKGNDIYPLYNLSARSVYPFRLQSPLINTSEQSSNSTPIQPFLYNSSLPSLHSHFRSPLYDKFQRPYGIFNHNLVSLNRLHLLRESELRYDLRSNLRALTQPQEKRLPTQMTPTQITQVIPRKECMYADLEFDSRFECGNLSFAAEINGVYCLLLHPDTNTNGYTNWFYFSVRSRVAGVYRFAILNVGKAARPYIQGRAIWSCCNGQWNNTYCVAYSRLNSTQGNNLFTLSFLCAFQRNQQIYFASNRPYSYSQLLKHLSKMEQVSQGCMHRRSVVASLAGNRVQVLMITDFTVRTPKRTVVLMARTHPGQTASSWLMHNLLQKLCSPQSAALRRLFVFRVFPMLNPDGVIHGNYRCSLSGRDLNRRWLQTSRGLYPEVHAVKRALLDESTPTCLVLDLHGHSQKSRAFFYGCPDKRNPHNPRLFPFLLSKLSSLFSYRECNFTLSSCKKSTARAVLYKSLRLNQVYTLEISQVDLAPKPTEAYSQMATALLSAISIHFGDVSPPCDYAKQLLSNTTLLRVGIDDSDGSQSQPSVCNLKLNETHNRVKGSKTTTNAFLTDIPLSRTRRHDQQLSREERSLHSTRAITSLARGTTMFRSLHKRKGPQSEMTLPYPEGEVFQTDEIETQPHVTRTAKFKDFCSTFQRRMVKPVTFELFGEDERQQSSYPCFSRPNKLKGFQSPLTLKMELQPHKRRPLVRGLPFKGSPLRNLALRSPRQGLRRQNLSTAIE